VKQLVAADNKAMRRMLSFLAGPDLIPAEAITASADAMGQPGPGLNLRIAAEWLANEHEMTGPIRLYDRFYVPLSHFYMHSSAAALMRHVQSGGKLRRRPSPAWARRAPVRLADGCAGALAAAIAHKTGGDSKPFARYAAQHLDRALVPALAIAGQGLWHSANWRELPKAYRTVKDVRHYLDGPGKTDDRAERAARLRTGFDDAFSILQIDLPNEAFTAAIDGLVDMVLRALDNEAARQVQDARSRPTTVR
jgi:hypothetical protein